MTTITILLGLLLLLLLQIQYCYYFYTAVLLLQLPCSTITITLLLLLLLPPLNIQPVVVVRGLKRQQVAALTNFVGCFFSLLFLFYLLRRWVTLPVPALGLWPEKHIPFHSTTSTSTSTSTLVLVTLTDPWLFLKGYSVQFCPLLGSSSLSGWRPIVHYPPPSISSPAFGHFGGLCATPNTPSKEKQPCILACKDELPQIQHLSEDKDW